MSIAFSLAKLKGEERRAILQAIQTQMQQVIIEGVTLVLQEFLEQEVTTKLGRSKRSPRRVSSQPRAIDWRCAFCGSSDANQFTRDGHYQRSLETGWGHLDTLRVPMLECQQCQHDVVAHFAILDRCHSESCVKERKEKSTCKTDNTGIDSSLWKRSFL